MLYFRVCHWHISELWPPVWTACFSCFIQGGVTDWSTLCPAIQFCAGAVSLSFWVLTWDSSAVVTFYFIELCVHVPMCMHITSPSTFTCVCVCQEDKIPVWWIYPSMTTHDLLLCLRFPCFHILQLIPHILHKTTIWLWWLVCHSLVIWFQFYGFKWTRHDSTYWISHLASKKPLV